tara:strand:- start:3564 stop:4202 length:639 start_codon:yes stop_codon:yes gene_type:complete
MKILNLYACLGGNRYKWDEVADIEVTAVELDADLARLYQERFPQDTVIVTDAHQYLLDHYSEFEFIWSSPPCPTHSKARFARRETTSTEYPDMKLYQEILFLQHWFKGKYVVENVKPYYTPLIPPKIRGRHHYWTNFPIPMDLENPELSFMEGKDEVNRYCAYHEIDLSTYKGGQRKDKIARNLVDYKAGKRILESAFGIMSQSNHNQLDLF